MSIWCSWPGIGWQDTAEVHYADGRKATEPGHFERGEVRAYAAGWSNHHPSPDVEAPAEIGVAHIAAWCVPGHEDADWDATGRWLRLDIDSPGARSWWTEDADGQPAAAPIHGSVILDRAAARALAADLLAWADRERRASNGGRMTAHAGREVWAVRVEGRETTWHDDKAGALAEVDELTLCGLAPQTWPVWVEGE